MWTSRGCAQGYPQAPLSLPCSLSGGRHPIPPLPGAWSQGRLNLPREPAKNGQTGACGGWGMGTRSRGVRGLGGSKDFLPKEGSSRRPAVAPLHLRSCAAPMWTTGSHSPVETHHFWARSPPEGKSVAWGYEGVPSDWRNALHPQASAGPVFSLPDRSWTPAWHCKLPTTFPSPRSFESQISGGKWTWELYFPTLHPIFQPPSPGIPRSWELTTSGSSPWFGRKSNCKNDPCPWYLPPSVIALPSGATRTKWPLTGISK